MAQMTIYLDDDTVRDIEEASRQRGTSVSKWVKERVRASLAHEWPPGYFDAFGSLYGVDFQEAPELLHGSDADREKL